MRNTLFLAFGFNSSILFAADDIAELEKAIARHMSTVKVTSINTTPVSGLYQVIIGAKVVYMTKDAQYMIDGDLINLSTNKNYTKDAKAAIRISEIDALGESDMVVYKPETVEHTITVVTDIDCPYCRRLHKEIPQYLGNSIKVRYIFMPLKGNEDINKTVSVWCADDRKAALDVAYASGVIEPKECDNPIVKHMELARNFGIRGTPAIILENGDILPGFVRENKLLTELNLLNVSSVQ